MLYGLLMTSVITRSGRISKRPERLELDEPIEDDYSDDEDENEDDDYSDDGDLCETDDEDEDEEDDEEEDENGNLKGFVVEDEEEDA